MLKQVVVAGRQNCIVLLLAILIAMFFVGAGCAKAQGDTYRHLELKLVRAGFSRPMVDRAFRSASPPMFHLVCDTMRTGLGPPSYAHFLAPSEIAAVRRFIDNHRYCFQEEKAEYGVDPAVISAILLVETDFGAFTGKTPVLAVFSSFAIMDRKANRDRVWWSLSPQDREYWGHKAFDKKLIERSAWAYRQLCALFELEETRAMSVASLRGSVMGAIGWPQFLPTSLVKYGVDGNGDGRIDLNEAPDAIFSIANYLRAYGWCQAKTFPQKEAVIFGYNHSTPYVLTVLGIAKRTSEELR